MAENAPNNLRTDALQNSIDSKDGLEDRFINNAYITNLFISRVDKIQDRLDKADLSDNKKKIIEQDLWSHLEVFAKYNVLGILEHVLSFQSFL